MHLWVTSESLNERFNDIRDVCGLFYNGDTQHRNQYNAIVVTFPFTMYNHAVTYIISTFCCIVRVIRQWHSLCMMKLKYNSQRRRKENSTLPQNLTVAESLSSQEAVPFDEHTVIIRALGITVVIAGLSFMRILGGMQFTIFSTAVFLMNQHLYNSLLFRKPFFDFVLSIIFGNLLVISRVNKLSTKIDHSNNTHKGEGVKVGKCKAAADEEMGMSHGGECSESTHRELHWQAAYGAGVDHGSFPEEKKDEISCSSGRSSNGGEIIDTWAFTSKDSLCLSASTGGVPGVIHKAREASESQLRDKPHDIHVCLGAEDHPGTIAFRGAVRSVAEKYSGKKYSLRARRDIKKRLKGRRYYVKKSSSPTDTWRRVSFFEIRKRCKECYEEEAAKVERELTLKDEIIEQESLVLSEQEPKPLQDSNKSLDSLEREIIGSPSGEQSLMGLLQTFTESYDGALHELQRIKKERQAAQNKSEPAPVADLAQQDLADDGVESDGENTENSNVLQQIRIISASETASTDKELPYSLPSDLDADFDDVTGADGTMTRSTIGSSTVPTYSFETNSTGLQFDQRSKEEMETTQDLWYGFNQGSYVIENVESQSPDDADEDMISSSYSIWSELGESFEIANRYLQEIAGTPSYSEASAPQSTSFATHETNRSTSNNQVSSPLRQVTSDDVLDRKKKRLKLQREIIQANRERAARQREIDPKAAKAKSRAKSGLFWMFRRRTGEKELEKIDELKELQEPNLNSVQYASRLKRIKDTNPYEAETESKASNRHNEDAKSRQATEASWGHEEAGTLETEDEVTMQTETTHNKTDESNAIDATAATEDETLSGKAQKPDWRDSLHLKINELTGQETSHFSSVYRQKKRDLEAKFYTSLKDGKPRPSESDQAALWTTAVTK